MYTPGPWSVDEVDNEGEYGDGGPDSHIGFKSFCVIDEAGNVLFDSLNATISQIEEHSDDEIGHHRAWDELAQQNLTLAAAAPDLLKALKAMVNKATKQNWNDQYPDELQAAFDAIDKAEGE